MNQSELMDFILNKLIIYQNKDYRVYLLKVCLNMLFD